MIIAVDFDGTLFKIDFPNIGEPIWETINWVKKQKENGNTLILWTCRENDYLKQALEACKSVGLEFDHINENTSELNELYGNDSRKVGADLYLDDKGLHPDSLIPKLEFKISGKELEKLYKWKEKHRCSFKKVKKKYEKQFAFSSPYGGWCQYKYIFTPTSFGDLVTVKCECGKEIKLKCDNFG